MSERKPRLTRKGTMKVTVEEAAVILGNPHWFDNPDAPKPVAEDKKEPEPEPAAKGGDTDEEKEGAAEEKKKRKSPAKKKKAPAKKKAAKAPKVEIVPPAKPEAISLAYELAGLLVLDRLTAADKAVLQAMKDTDLVIVQGSADQTEKVARAVKVPCKVVAPAAFDGLELVPRATVYVNCMATFTPEGIRKLTAFVQAGGLVVSTDHAISEIEKAFPGMIANGGSTRDTEIAVQLTSQQHPVLAGFFDEDTHPKWKMAGGSWAVKILAADKVDTLLRSDDLKIMCGGNDAVVVTFPVGAGRVYHMTSHFYLQGSAVYSDMPASEYAKRKAASEALVKRFVEEEAKPGSTLAKGNVQAAATSVEFLVRSIVDHIHRVETGGTSTSEAPVVEAPTTTEAPAAAPAAK
jgi:hypothetical protein